MTGGRGMVGRNILEHPMVDYFTFLSPTRSELDLRNFDQVQNYLVEHAPEFVIHAAGLVGGIQANIARPVDFLVDNIDLGRNVILASRKAGVKKLLNLSSSCMYPRNASNPLTEDLILQGELEPTNEGYALAKIVRCVFVNTYKKKIWHSNTKLLFLVIYMGVLISLTQSTHT